MSSNFSKDPNEHLDYQFNWANERLDATTEPTEQISTYTIKVPSGITLESSSITNGVNKDGVSMPNSCVTVFLSGGVIPEVYRIECNIITTSSPPRTYEESLYITMVNK